MEARAIVVISEISADLEILAAKWIMVNRKKPVIGFIAGETAPEGRPLGHVGAIVAGTDESAAAMKQAFCEGSIHMVASQATIGAKVKGEQG